MRTPKLMKICGKNVKIVFKKYLNDGKDDLLGLADVNNNVIYLRTRMEEQKRLEVLIHECFHFIDETMLFGMGEKKVNNWAIEVIRLIKDNKIKIQ